jgi:hypothetical protein
MEKQNKKHRGKKQKKHTLEIITEKNMLVKLWFANVEST